MKAKNCMYISENYVCKHLPLWPKVPQKHKMRALDQSIQQFLHGFCQLKVTELGEL